MLLDVGGGAKMRRRTAQPSAVVDEQSFIAAWRAGELAAQLTYR